MLRLVNEGFSCTINGRLYGILYSFCSVKYICFIHTNVKKTVAVTISFLYSRNMLTALTYTRHLYINSSQTTQSRHTYTRSLSHTALSHTPCSHTDTVFSHMQLLHTHSSHSHTILKHIQLLHTHTHRLLTYIAFTHTALSHTQLP